MLLQPVKRERRLVRNDVHVFRYALRRYNEVFVRINIYLLLLVNIHLLTYIKLVMQMKDESRVVKTNANLS